MFRQNPNVVYREILDEVVLVPISGNTADMEKIYSLNESAGFIWKQLDGTIDVSAVGRALADEYELPQSMDSTKEVIELIDKLEEAGLVESVVTTVVP